MAERGAVLAIHPTGNTRYFLVVDEIIGWSVTRHSGDTWTSVRTSHGELPDFRGDWSNEIRDAVELWRAKEKGDGTAGDADAGTGSR